MPSFRRVLESVLETYTRKRGEVEASAKEILDALKTRSQKQSSSKLDSLLIENAFIHLSDSFDKYNGGFGRAPKFPQPTTLDLLMRVGMNEGFKHSNRMVELTLIKMAKGGIFDHLGGGFHRYSVDSQWHVPHFEKMLYDNALLVGTYLHQFQLTGGKIYRDIVEQTLDYTRREMTHPLGGFYSSQDADSEGVEGKSYVWSRDEIMRLLGGKDGSIFCKYFGITANGNFEGKNILRIPEEDDKIASSLGMEPKELMNIIANSKKIMLDAREKREQPQRDDKILTSWNGLMLSSLSESSSSLGDEKLREAAEKNATFIMNNMRTNGRLLHSWKNGGAKVDGFLEDYAFLGYGLVDLYQATFEPRWLGEAITLGEEIIELFLDKKNGRFFDTSINHEKLFKRPSSTFDSAVPSGGSVATRLLQRLFAFTGNELFSDSSRSALRSASNYFESYSTGMTNWLIALDSELNPPREIAIVGDLKAKLSQEMLSVVRNGYRPNIVVAFQPNGEDFSETIP
ncbi:MAG: thioredoxin domain-containing protein, partial [Nitrososphaerales archaeon]